MLLQLPGESEEALSAAHVILNCITQQFECKHCGASRRLVLPVPINTIVADSLVFQEAHAACKPVVRATGKALAE